MKTRKVLKRNENARKLKKLTEIEKLEIRKVLGRRGKLHRWVGGLTGSTAGWVAHRIQETDYLKATALTTSRERFYARKH